MVFYILWIYLCRIADQWILITLPAQYHRNDWTNIYTQKRPYLTHARTQAFILGLGGYQIDYITYTYKYSKSNKWRAFRNFSLAYSLEAGEMIIEDYIQWIGYSTSGLREILRDFADCCWFNGWAPQDEPKVVFRKFRAFTNCLVDVFFSRYIYNQILLQDIWNILHSLVLCCRFIVECGLFGS